MIITNFYERTFLPEIAYGATGGPEFSTDIITSSNGYEQRNINWLNSRNRYNLAPAIKNKEQLEYLISFFKACQGKAIGFRFKDWMDFQIKNQVIAAGDGEAKEFQLIKTYNAVADQILSPVFSSRAKSASSSSSSSTEAQPSIEDLINSSFKIPGQVTLTRGGVIRKISKPIAETIKIYIDEKQVLAEIDSKTGIIKFAEAPEEGSIIKAEGEFDVPVRFDTDHLTTSIENYGVYSHYEIPLIEIKL